MSINRYYEDELSYLRELGEQFARANPKLASFLGRESDDPDVERMLEAFAFLTGRLRQRLDDELPELATNLLQLVNPQLLKPIPPMTMISFRPKPGAGTERLEVPRNTTIASQSVKGSECLFTTRYLVSDACVLARKTLVTAALGTFDATITTLRAHENGPDGTPNPTYRCLFPEAPPPGTVAPCAEAGVLGALAGLAGSLAALETIRAIVGFGESLVGKLLMIDARSMRFETLSYAYDPENPLTGTGTRITDLSEHVKAA